MVQILFFSLLRDPYPRVLTLRIIEAQRAAQDD